MIPCGGAGFSPQQRLSPPEKFNREELPPEMRLYHGTYSFFDKFLCCYKKDSQKAIEVLMFRNYYQRIRTASHKVSSSSLAHLGTIGRSGIWILYTWILQVGLHTVYLGTIGRSRYCILLDTVLNIVYLDTIGRFRYCLLGYYRQVQILYTWILQVG